MSTNCEACGYRDNEVKSGSAISEQGKRVTLTVEDKDDLSRDILKVCIYRRNSSREKTLTSASRASHVDLRSPKSTLS